MICILAFRVFRCEPEILEGLLISLAELKVNSKRRGVFMGLNAPEVLHLFADSSVQADTPDSREPLVEYLVIDSVEKAVAAGDGAVR